MARFEAIPLQKFKALVDAAFSQQPQALVWLSQGALHLGDSPLSPSSLVIDLGEEKIRPGAPAADEPSPLSPATPVDDLEAQRRTGHFVVTIKGRKWSCQSHKSVLITSLKELEGVAPGTLARLSDELRRVSKKRWIVARSQDELYVNRKLKDMSVRLNDDWWVGTNYSADEITKHLQRAVRCAGLEWGRDFSINRLT